VASALRNVFVGRVQEMPRQYENFERAMEKGVAFVPGSAFFTDKRSCTYGRLNFTNSSLESIQRGASLLHEAYRTLER
jgi:2-aminoadipate transaminase